MKSAARWVIVSLLAFGLFPLSIAAPASANANPAAFTAASPAVGSKFGGNTVRLSGNFSSDSAHVSQVVSVALSASNSVSQMAFTVDSSGTVSATIPALSPAASGPAEIVVTFTASTVITVSYTILTATATQSSVAKAQARGSFSAIIGGYGFANSNISDTFISTSRAIVSISNQVLNDGQVSVSVPVLNASSRSSAAFLGVSFVDGSPTSYIPIELTGPTVSAVLPNSGTAAGGTAITISGQGFMDGNGTPTVTGIRIGSDVIANGNFTVLSDTTISATISSRAGNNKTVGANRVAVFYADDVSNSDVVFYYFTPVREAAQDVSQLVMLKDLASRSNRKPVFRTSQRPFLVTGTDSLTRQGYTYETNFGYTGAAAYEREGHQPGYTKKLVNGQLVTIGNPNLSSATVTSQTKGSTFSTGRGSFVAPQDSTVLRSNGRCGENINSFDAGDGQGVTVSYCSVFGPEIYSETFYGKQGQSLGFNWLAIGEADDYSVYGYLVAVPNESFIPKTDAASHTLVTHGVGSYTQASSWSAATAEIPADGLYRFRFVNGSYDGTGGFVIGSTFVISSVYEAGLTNRINFGPIGDQIGTGGTPLTVNASALSGGEVTISARTPSVCTVSTNHANSSTSVTITKVAFGTCILVASRGLDGEYAPAADKMVAFEIRNTAIAPNAPVITQINSGNQSLNVLFVAPSRDGGTAITSYEYSTDGGSTWASASPTSTATNITITSLSSNAQAALVNGTTYSIRVRAVTSTFQGAQSNAAAGVPNAPTVPVLSYSSAVVTRTVNLQTQIFAPVNSGGAVALYSYSGTLPPGLSLNTATGIISGTPTQVGTSTIQVTGENTTNTSSPVSLTINIVATAANRPDLTWSPAILVEYTATVGTSFTGPTPSNSNTVDPAQFTIQPVLPDGLEIDATTGVISGVPTVTSSSVAYVVTATNAAGSSTVTLVLRVLPAAVSNTGGSGGSGANTPYNGPEITLVTPNVVNTSGGQLIRVEGRRLGVGNHVTLAGVRVQLESSTTTGFTFIMPALSVQVLDMLYTYDGGARLTYMNAIRVIAPVAPPVVATVSPTTSPVAPNPAPKPWSAIGIASKFAPGSAVVNSAVRAQVNQMLRLYGSRATTIQCTGFTMGPSVLRVDAKLSLDRAQAVCRLIKQLRPRLTVISATGRQELRLGGEVRRVEVLFRAR